MNAIQFPLSRITIAFIFGILFAHWGEIEFIWASLFIAISLIVFCAVYFLTQKRMRPTLGFGLAAYLLSFFLGSFSMLVSSGWNQRDNFIYKVDSFEKPQQLEVVLREKLKQTPKYHRYVGVVKQIENKTCSGKLILNFQTKGISKDMRIGTILHLNTVVVKHKPPLNPNQFDYGKYLSVKSIVAQSYVSGSQYQVGSIYQKDIYYYSDCLRSRLLDNLEKVNFGTTELNILAALLLGQQQEISQEIVRDYQMAGAVHILSVSGLHIGFIVLFLNWILRYLPKTKWGNLLKLLATAISLWGFAFIAGLSPSVIRSVTMFSFVAVGMYLNRKTNMFHTLLVSLLIILLFEPSFLFDVGFQLSYLALFFILWLQPLLAELWMPKNKILTYFWDIITVSFAAQIGTFPISIYYFHQFPGLFFLTNLVVIPFLSIIMAVGLLLMTLSLFNFMPELLVTLVEKLIAVLNQIIHWVASFDEFVVSNISISNIMVLSCYLMIVSAVLYLRKPKYHRLMFFLLTIILLQISYYYKKWETELTQDWIVFNIPKSTLLAERNGDKVRVYKADDTSSNDPLQPYLVANFSKVTREYPIPRLMFIQNKKIALVDSSGSYPKGKNPDILLLRQSPKINLNRVFENCKPKIVIADASNYRSFVTLWEATCRKEKIPFHNTYEKGFYQLKN